MHVPRLSRITSASQRIVLALFVGLFISAGLGPVVSANAQSRTNTTKAPARVVTLPPKRFTDTSAIKTIQSAKTVSAVETALNTFLRQYGMTTQLTTVRPSTYAAQYNTYKIVAAADLPALKTYASMFVDEWAKYPPSWVAYSGAKSVAIVKNLSVVGWARSAAPDPVGDAMYYDIGYTGVYAAGVIHHEFDHLATFNAFGTYAPYDATWTSYNPAGFVYGNGGTSCYPAGTCAGAHPLAGFVTGYATSAIEEDKAELFSYLMTTSYYKDLKTWTATDTNLRNKVTAYQNYLGQKSPQMTGTYFSDIHGLSTTTVR